MLLSRLPAREILPNGRSHLYPYRVLLVEDDPDQAELVMDFLRAAGPFKVDWAENLGALWDHLELVVHEILLIDYRLPDGTGLEALGEMRRKGYDLPVIMITGRGDERLAVQAMQLGAVDYLVKSTDYLQTLPALIQKAVRAHELQHSVRSSLEQVRYQALLLNNVRDAVVVWNTEGKITYWNPAAEALFGIAAADRLGQPVQRCYFESFSPVIRQPPTDGTSGQEIERRCRLKDGRTLWISSRVSTLRDFGDDGRLIGFMDVARDISGRRQAEDQLIRSHADLQASAAALRQSEARYRAVSELTSDFVYALQVNPDRTFNCEWVTDAFETVTGFDPNEIDWQEHWLNLIDPDDNTSAQQLTLRLLSGEKDVREFRILTKAGEVCWVRHYAQPVWDAGESRVVRIYGAVKDLSERKAMEAQIQSAQTRLAQAARLAAIGELASGVAHHINNPLTTIIAEAQLLLASVPQGHSGRESAEAIEQAGWRVQKTVQQLLDFSKPDAGTRQWLAVNDTISVALDLLRNRIESAGIRLEIDLAEDLPAVLGHSRQLCDLWVNLLLLAYDGANGQPRTIRVLSERVSRERAELSEDTGFLAGPKGAVQVEVFDDGQPIPPAELAVLFEPNFVKAPGGRGTGIELNICYEIVRQHHGQIRVESSLQAGTTFHVRIPCEVESDRSEHPSR